MADVRLDVRWTGTGLEFEGGPPGGARARVDGNGRTAVSPVQTLLLSLAACTAADVVEILTKMRVPLEALELVAEGDRVAQPPRRYERIRLEYRVRAPADAEEKVRRAVSLSHEKYCSVMHTLRPDIVVETEVKLV